MEATRDCRLRYQVANGEVRDMQTMGFHLMESPDILAPEKRSYEEEDYPERDGVKIYPYTVDKAFEYTVKLLYFGELETMNSAIRSLWNSFFEPTNNGDVKKALPVTIYNLYKGVKIVGYPTKMPGSETIVQVMQGAFIFELTLYVAEPNKCNFNYQDNFDGVVLPEPKEEALRRMAKGVKMGYGEKNVYSSSFNGTILTSPPIQIGTSDFSIEYYGNAYGSGSGAPLLFNKANQGTPNAPTYFQVYGLNLGRNVLDWVTFGVPDGGNIATDSLNFKYLAPDLSTKFHLVITRQGRMINVYIDNTLVASKEQTEIKDLGAFVLGILNSSDVGFARVWNYALSSSEVATLYNNGDPAGHVLPAKLKDGEQRCIAEYLPQNLIPTAEGSVVKWLDSAPQLPEANGILPPLDASVGGYDLAAIGNPKIII